jgi:hypothetical protein
MEITRFSHAPLEFLEHAALMLRPSAAEKNRALQKAKDIPSINPFRIKSLQLPQLRLILNS